MGKRVSSSSSSSSSSDSDSSSSSSSEEERKRRKKKRKREKQKRNEKKKKKKKKTGKKKKASRAKKKKRQRVDSSPEQFSEQRAGSPRRNSREQGVADAAAGATRVQKDEEDEAGESAAGAYQAKGPNPGQWHAAARQKKTSQKSADTSALPKSSLEGKTVHWVHGKGYVEGPPPADHPGLASMMGGVPPPGLVTGPPPGITVAVPPAQYYPPPAAYFPPPAFVPIMQPGSWAAGGGAQQQGASAPSAPSAVPPWPAAAGAAAVPPPHQPLELGSGWVQYWDATKSAHYYHHATSGVTQWVSL